MSGQRGTVRFQRPGGVVGDRAGGGHEIFAATVRGSLPWVGEGVMGAFDAATRRIRSRRTTAEGWTVFTSRLRS